MGPNGRPIPGGYQMMTAPSAVPGQPGVTVQQYTQVIPPQQTSAAPTVITVQTAPAPAAPQVTPMPMPNTPPPVMINGGGGAFPQAGLPR